MSCFIRAEVFKKRIFRSP